MNILPMINAVVNIREKFSLPLAGMEIRTEFF
jgi:hypothetical protein